MAIQFTDFTKAPIQQAPWANVLESALKGYQMSQEPAKMAEEQKKRELANQLSALEVQHKPKEFELNDQQKTLANALQKLALEHKPTEYQLSDDVKRSTIEKNKKGGALKLTGDIANFKLTHPDASDDEVREFADKLFKSKIDHMNTSTERANVLNKTQDARSQTNQGKLLTEAKDVEDGYIPGTGRTQTFDNPQLQKFYKDQYALKLQKERSDSVTRNRAIYATLVDNTFDNINVDKLVQYSGIEGEINKLLARGQLVPEKELQKYQEYKAEITKVQVLAKQIRQFYSDSISPSNLQTLKDISNPAKWSESSAAAKAQFQAFKNIVKQETGIYRSALSSPEVFQAPPQGSSNNQNAANEDKAGKVLNLVTGAWEKE